jgi:hypothetical protein
MKQKQKEKKKKLKIFSRSATGPPLFDTFVETAGIEKKDEERLPSC